MLKKRRRRRGEERKKMYAEHILRYFRIGKAKIKSETETENQASEMKRRLTQPLPHTKYNHLPRSTKAHFAHFFFSIPSFF